MMLNISSIFSIFDPTLIPHLRDNTFSISLLSVLFTIVFLHPPPHRYSLSYVSVGILSKILRQSYRSTRDLFEGYCLWKIRRRKQDWAGRASDSDAESWPTQWRTLEQRLLFGSIPHWTEVPGPATPAGPIHWLGVAQKELSLQSLQLIPALP